jgi:hypothetical protein
MTEDFLTVRMHGAIARGTRLNARLTTEGGGLVAKPEADALPASRYLSMP